MNVWKTFKALVFVVEFLAFNVFFALLLSGYPELQIALVIWVICVLIGAVYFAWKESKSD